MADAKIRIIGKDETKGAFSSANRGMKTLGKTTGLLTAGIAALGVTISAGLVIGGLTKAIGSAVSLAEESSKLGVIFKNVRTQAKAVGQDLQKNFGISELAATKLLGATGDLLTGFGFTSSSALDLSADVQKLAVDIASFSNLQGGASRASVIITKALLGETDSLVALGVKIKEANINAKAQELGLKKVNGQLTNQDKALVTLTLITEQSKNAIGDFARTQDSTANQSKIFGERLTDLSTVAGKVLLPTFGKVLTILNKVLNTTINFIRTDKLQIAVIKELEKQEAKFVDQLNNETNARNKLNIGKRLADVRAELTLKRDQVAIELKLAAIEDAKAAKEANVITRKANTLQGLKDEIKLNLELQEQKKLDIKSDELKIATNQLRQDGQLLILEGLKKEFKLTQQQIELDKVKAARQEQAIFNTLQAGAVLASIGKKNAVLGKGIAIAQATISGFLAVNKTLGQGGVFAVPLAISIGALAAANVAKIAATPAFQTPEGGVRTVPGSSNDAVPVIAHGGEEFSRGGSSGITIIVEGNIFDSEETLDSFQTGLMDFQNRTGAAFAS